MFTTSVPRSPKAPDPTRTPLAFEVSPTRAAPTATHRPQSTLEVDETELQGRQVQFGYVALAGSPDPLAALAIRFNATNAWDIQVKPQAFASHTELRARLDSPGKQDPLALVIGTGSELSASAKKLIDLAPYLEDPNWGLPAEDQQDFLPSLLAAGESGGQRLSLPFSHSLQVIYYNQTLAKSLGFESAPQTPDAFQRQACALPGGGYAVTLDYASAAAWMLAYGQDLGGALGQNYAMNGPGARLAYTFLRGLLDEGCAYLPANRYPNQEFAGGAALFIAGSSASLAQQQAEFERLDSADRWTAIAFPGPGSPDQVLSTGASLAIVKSNPEQQLAAWLFARFLVSPENQAEWVRQTGLLPVRLSAVDLLSEYSASHPQWKAAAGLLPQAVPEPQVVSWELVRWAVQDSLARLLSPTFNDTMITDLVKMLGDTAAELDKQYP